MQLANEWPICEPSPSTVPKLAALEFELVAYSFSKRSVGNSNTRKIENKMFAAT